MSPKIRVCSPILVLEGITVLNDPRTAAMCDVKLFIELDRGEEIRKVMMG